MKTDEANNLYWKLSGAVWVPLWALRSAQLALRSPAPTIKGMASD
jgi:hypothetical protein